MTTRLVHVGQEAQQPLHRAARDLGLRRTGGGVVAERLQAPVDVDAELEQLRRSGLARGVADPIADHAHAPARHEAAEGIDARTRGPGRRLLRDGEAALEAEPSTVAGVALAVAARLEHDVATQADRRRAAVDCDVDVGCAARGATVADGLGQRLRRRLRVGARLRGRLRRRLRRGLGRRGRIGLGQRIGGRVGIRRGVRIGFGIGRRITGIARRHLDLDQRRRRARARRPQCQRQAQRGAAHMRISSSP